MKDSEDRSAQQARQVRPLLVEHQVQICRVFGRFEFSDLSEIKNYVSGCKARVDRKLKLSGYVLYYY